MPKQPLTIYWCRCEFRMLDNPALFHATEYASEKQTQFLPVSFLDTDLVESNWMNIGTNRRLLLAKILGEYSKNFKSFHIQTGEVSDFFERIGQEYELTVFANNDGDPYSRRRFKKIHDILKKHNCELKIIEDYFSINKDLVSGSGNIYSVFSPLRNASIDTFLSSQTLPKPDLTRLNYLHLSDSLPISDIYQHIQKPNILEYGEDYTLNLDELLPESNLQSWFITEDSCLQHFETYTKNSIITYKKDRDSLEKDSLSYTSTSKMSQALKWGLVSSRTLKDIILKYHPKPKSDENLFQYISELIWREFYRYILWHNPNVLDTEFQPKYRSTIQWISGVEAQHRFKSWILGKTGYPLVDAAMNQIAQTGWMHNRARMMVASILTKNLGIDWRWGQDYFRRVLVDFDEASNNGGWQWAASVGSDPKPIRIFNPYIQAETHDKNKKYQSKWLPRDYDFTKKPIVEHRQARDEALKRYNLSGSKEGMAIRDF